MKIDHIAIYVNDLECVKAFFINYFGAKSNDMYYNKKTQLKTYFLTFGGETTLEIMNLPSLPKQNNSLVKEGYIHMAISVGSKEIVNSLTSKLSKAGYEILSNPRITGDGYYESKILGPQDIQIEIVE